MLKGGHKPCKLMLCQDHNGLAKMAYCMPMGVLTVKLVTGTLWARMDIWASTIKIAYADYIAGRLRRS